MQREKPEFLHIWARQLLKEHSFICRRYGLELTRPIVEIVDVSSYWGKWITETGTISLARSLIISQPWDAVLNVLKHEMAHQFVAEELDGAPGHGPDFRKGCEILGIPAPFRRASGPISNANKAGPDRYISDSERILRKIRKILALTDSTNEHESLLAMQKARQLLDKYNLNEEIAGDNNNPPYSNLLISLKRKRIGCYHRAICSLLVDYFHAQIVIAPLYDAHDLTTYKGIDILGKTGNVKIAGYVYHFLMDRLPSLWHEHQAANHGPKNGRNSYWLGVLKGFREGLGNDRQAGAKTKGPPTASPLPLPPIAINDPAMGLFVASRYPKLQKSRSRSTRVDQLRFEAGLKDGRLLKFRKGLNRGGSRQRLLGEY